MWLMVRQIYYLINTDVDYVQQTPGGNCVLDPCQPGQAEKCLQSIAE
jgi:hypothetical protein